jgi:hypothetical protein
MNRTIGSMTASILNLPQYRNRLGRQIMAETPKTNKPDFKNGFPIRDLGDGSMISGQVDGEELVLVRRGDEFFAIGARCTHYGGPLAEGLIVGDTVRAVPGTTHVSVSGMAKRCGHPLLIQSHVGELKDWATRFLFVRKLRHRLPSAERRVQARL